MYVSLIIIAYTYCVMNLQQVRWNCKAHEESSAVIMLQSVILCSPPLQSTVSLPILLGLSVMLAELERQQQDYKYNVIYDTHDNRDTFTYIHLHTFTHMHTLKSCSHYTHPESTQVINYTV